MVSCNFGFVFTNLLQGVGFVFTSLPLGVGFVFTKRRFYSPFATRTFSFPRRLCARGLQLSLSPPRGVAERRETRGTMTRYPGVLVTRHARRLRGALRLQRETRASRRSTVAILGRGPCFHLRHFLRIRAASCSRPGRSARRTGSRASRGGGYEPPPRDATPRSAHGPSPE